MTYKSDGSAVVGFNNLAGGLILGTKTDAALGLGLASQRTASQQADPRYPLPITRQPDYAPVRVLLDKFRALQDLGLCLAASEVQWHQSRLTGNLRGSAELPIRLTPVSAAKSQSLSCACVPSLDCHSRVASQVADDEV